MKPGGRRTRGGETKSIDRWCCGTHLLVAATLTLAACAGAAPRSPAATLAGTTWELHAIQSMDDAQGTVRVAEPKRFTLRFGADGRASLRLDCNRGTGDWKAKAASADSGTLRFGPIAATRALCPPPQLDERIARDLAYVRSYRLTGGRLFMSLMADGGIYEWHPQHD